MRDCIAGLLANLSVKDFQDIEGELNRAICWYLSCDRYWEDTKRHHRHTPWYLLITFLFLLSSGISACYYVVSLLLRYVILKDTFFFIDFDVFMRIHEEALFVVNFASKVGFYIISSSILHSKDIQIPA